jgi:toxin ParE1/3/4
VRATRQARVRAVPHAQFDLIAIWAGLADDSHKQADGFLDRIGQQLCKLAELPTLGCERPDLGTGWRSYPVGDYHIYFRAADRGIEVVRVLHATCDPGSWPRVETP